MIIEIREASWTAPVLWHFARKRKIRRISAELFCANDNLICYSHRKKSKRRLGPATPLATDSDLRKPHQQPARKIKVRLILAGQKGVFLFATARHSHIPRCLKCLALRVIDLKSSFGRTARWHATDKLASRENCPDLPGIASDRGFYIPPRP
jgi:hypothetical protein